MVAEAIDVAAVDELSGASLILNPHKDTVLSMRHRVLSCLGEDDVDDSEALEAVRRLLASGDLVVASDEQQPTIPTCRACGCTEEFACDNGCEWVNAEQTLCTSCGGAR